MVRGPKKHQKRLNTPSHWLLDKLGGIFGPKPSSGPHPTRECLPLIMILRNRLKYALNGREVTTILVQRLVKIDGNTRTDPTYPVGFNDVVEILRTNEFFRLMIDPKGRYILHRITKNESGYKLCRVKKITIGSKGLPYVNTNDGRTIRYPDPIIKAKDTIVVTIATNKITDYIKSETGHLAIVLRGHNAGRIGLIIHQETHLGSHTIITLGDALGNNFSTRNENVFVIGN